MWFCEENFGYQTIGAYNFLLNNYISGRLDGWVCSDCSDLLKRNKEIW